MDPVFEAFSVQHFSVLLLFAVFTAFVIYLGKISNERTKTHIGFSISFLALSVMVIDLVYRLLTGIFDILNDLPLFLCDLVVCILPFVILQKSRKWLGILYFWAIAGTLQALITPELKQGFPAFEFFRYFIMHAGIVTAVLYAIIVWKIRIGWRDFYLAIVYAQIYLVCIHIINVILSSNYSYTMQKPEGRTILDLMGAWPWYLLWAEGLMIALFCLLMVPFLFAKSAEEESIEFP